MKYFLYTLLFVIFQPGIAVSYSDSEAKRFLKNCTRLSRCADIDVSFPYSLDTSPSYCSPPGMQLSCNNNNTLLLTLPNAGKFEIANISLGTTRITFNETWVSCPLQELISINFTTSPYRIFTIGIPFGFLNCSRKISFNDTEIAGPIACLSDVHHFVYLVLVSVKMMTAPSGCYGVPIPNGRRLLIPSDFYNPFSEESSVLYFTQMPVMDLRWRSEEMMFTCHRCYDEGKNCVYSHSKNKVYCRYKGPRVDLVAGLSVVGFLIFIVVAVVLFKLIKSYKEEKVIQKVEKLLENYWSMAPTRYTYAEVIKIAKRFKYKLGQGGFGTVYKGELPNGIPVAVKLLEKYVGEGEDFINEVSTIGRIHHFNIVHLLGFCSEGSRRALIYEYMPNESLAKHIFSEGELKASSMEKMQDIAVGIARGIEYMHQGCSQRILHFDIKPHNILLDYNFKPKIADFGLAKLCSKEQSIVTMTAVRGTMGYIAPELYSRNFGMVSYKSDVYSFGMLLLEMIGRRKNLDPDVRNQSQIYFPEWVYDQLIHNDQVLKMIFKMNEKEETIMKKLIIVALWCIQWSPTDRPSMTRVLQMLTEDSESLQIPPKPFVSSLDLI